MDRDVDLIFLEYAINDGYTVSSSSCSIVLAAALTGQAVATEAAAVAAAAYMRPHLCHLLQTQIDLLFCLQVLASHLTMLHANLLLLLLLSGHFRQHAACAGL